jgi:tRNA(Ile)-lysidine synthase
VLEKTIRYICEQSLLHAGDRVAVAVSGGADSVALLRVFLELRAELGIVLAVAHFNHGLRDEALADEAFVAEIAKERGLQFFLGRADVRDHAFTSKLSIEAAGRELRYRWFSSLAEEQRLDAIATAHTLDDQAETVLLKLLRGTGTKGLAGIYPVVRLEASGAKAQSSQEGPDDAPEGAPLQDMSEAGSDGVTLQGAVIGLNLRIIRPLLQVTRDEVEGYLTSLGQSWREDESNLDRRFLRNRVRHELLPLLEREFNPNVRQTMSDLAEIARGEEEFWQNLVDREVQARLTPANAPMVKPLLSRSLDAGLNARSSTELPGNSFSDPQPAASTEPRGAATAPCRLDLNGFAQLPLALQRRLLKRFAGRQGLALDFEHIERLRRCALGEVSKAELPGGNIALRLGLSLDLRPPSSPAPGISYRYLLPIPGEVHVAELGLTLRAAIVPAKFAQEPAPGELLGLDLIGSELTVRNWLPGDRFWPSHSRSDEKLKRLFAEQHIPAGARPTWPVILSGSEIVWVRGFLVGNAYRWKGVGEAVRVEVLAV